MPNEVITIRLSLPYGLGPVNCYLVKNPQGFVLIDTGNSGARSNLVAELERAGCFPGSLGLIVLTHGDFDHTGNAAYLRSRYNPRIAMHPDDFGMVERGDMFWNRKKTNFLFKALSPLLFRFKKTDRFTPDIALGDGEELGRYGLEAQALSLPGHSKGSIGILTAEGDLFCGDLLTNPDQPVLNDIMDNTSAAFMSIDKLRGYTIYTVYPGHGDPFLMKDFLDNFNR